MTRRKYNILWTGIHIGILLLILFVAWRVWGGGPPGDVTKWAGTDIPHSPVFNWLPVFPALTILAVFLPWRRGYLDFSVVAVAGVCANLYARMGGPFGDNQLAALLACGLVGLTVGVFNAVIARFGRLASVLGTGAAAVLLLSLGPAMFVVSRPATTGWAHPPDTLTQAALVLAAVAAVALDVGFGFTCAGRRLSGPGTAALDTARAGYREWTDTAVLFIGAALIASLAGALSGAQPAAPNFGGSQEPADVAYVAVLIGGANLLGGRGSACLALFAGWAVTVSAKLVQASQWAGYEPSPDYRPLVSAGIGALFVCLYLIRQHFEPGEPDRPPAPGLC